MKLTKHPVAAMCLVMFALLMNGQSVQTQDATAAKLIDVGQNRKNQRRKGERTEIVVGRFNSINMWGDNGNCLINSGSDNSYFEIHLNSIQHYYKGAKVTARFVKDKGLLSEGRRVRAWYKIGEEFPYIFRIEYQEG